MSFDPLAAEKVAEAIQTLREYFDNVQILCNRYDPEVGTEHYARGEGNLFARRDQAREWLLRLDVNDREEQKAQIKREEEE